MGRDHRVAQFYPHPRFPPEITNEVEEKEEDLGTGVPARLCLPFSKITTVGISGSPGSSGFVSVRKTRKDYGSFLHPAGYGVRRDSHVPDAVIKGFSGFIYMFVFGTFFIF